MLLVQGCFDHCLNMDKIKRSQARYGTSHFPMVHVIGPRGSYSCGPAMDHSYLDSTIYVCTWWLTSTDTCLFTIYTGYQPTNIVSCLPLHVS